MPDRDGVAAGGGGDASRLLAVVSALSRPLTADQVADVVLQQGVSALGARAGVLTVVDETGLALRILGSTGYPAESIAPYARAFPLTLPVPLCDCIRSGDLVLIGSLEDLAARYPDVDRAPFATDRAYASIPMIFAGRAIGAIGISFPADRGFSADEQLYMRILAAQAGQALERVRLQQAHEQAMNRMAVTQEISRVLSRTALAVDDVLATVVREVAGRLGDTCSIGMLSDDGQWLHRAAGHSQDAALQALIDRLHASPQRVDEGLAGEVARTGRAIVMPTATAESLKPHIAARYLPQLQALGIHSLILMPMTSAGRVVGVIGASRSLPAPPFAPEDALLLEKIADRTAAAVEQARAFEEATRSAARSRHVAGQLSRLQQVTALLAQAITPDDIAGVLVSQGYAIAGATMGAVALLGPDGRSIRLLGAAGVPPQTLGHLERATIDVPRPIADAIRTGSPVWLHDRDAYRASYPQSADDLGEGVGAIACQPLRVQGRVIGALGMGFDTAQDFDADARRLIETLAHQCAQALDRSLLYDALRSREEELRLIIDSVPDLISYIDAAGVYRLANRAYDTWFGIAASSIVGRPMANVIGADQVARIAPLVDRVLAGEAVAYEMDLTYPAIGTRWVEVHYAPRTGPDGRVVGFVARVHDLTERKKATEMQAFLSDASAVLASSIDYDTTLANVARLAVPHIADWCAVDLLMDDGTIDRVAIEHPDPERIAILQELARRHPIRTSHDHGAGFVIRTGAASFIPVIPEDLIDQVLPDPDSARLMRALGLVSSLIVPMTLGGRTIGSITLATAESGRVLGDAEMRLAQDLAQRAAYAVVNARLYLSEKEARAMAEEAAQAREEFLSIASHELKTPLTALHLQTEILQRRLQRAEEGSLPVQDLLHRLHANVEQVDRLTSLVNELLDVSRLSQGRLLLELEPVDLAALARTVIDRVSADASRHGSPIQLDHDGPVPGTWDAFRLEQVLTNLLSNAIKYGKGRPIVVTVRRQGDTVTLQVRDHGIGIDPADQGRLFQRFERLVSARHYGGFGLGLWIVRQIVEAMGGTITVASALGQGARFTVTLPTSGVPAAPAGPDEVRRD